MITSNLVMPLIVTSTIATIIFIGLGFLPKPSRAAALWSAGFASAMVGSYMWLAYEVWDILQFRAVGSGLVIAPMALIWSGLRARRRARRPFIPLALAYLIATPLALTLISFTPAYGVFFRAMFAVTVIFAVLTVVELVRLRGHELDDSYPLIATCVAFVLLAVIIVVDGVLVASQISDNPASAQFLLTINTIGANAFVICTLVTVLLLTLRGKSDPRTAYSGFERTVRDRLNRAEATNDLWWSVLDIRLDDPEEIRAASSTAAFNATSERFGRDVELALPADADIERMSATRIIALVPRAQGSIRELLINLLERISTETERQAVPIRLSASIGWAQVETVGYEYDELIQAASDAAERAHANGGARWERVRSAAERAL